MATAKEQLLSMMDPQQARLMDQQLQTQQNIQRSQGAGMLSGLVQGTLGGMQSVQGALGKPQVGPNELMAQQAQQAQQKQKTISDAMSGPREGNRVQQLRQIAQRLRSTGTFEAIMKAEQIDAQADELEYKIGDLNLQKAKIQATRGKNSNSVTSTEGEHFRDANGNIYGTVLTTDKSTGSVDVKYVNLTGGPEYDGTSKLVPVIKSGSYSGMTPMEASDLESAKQGKIQTSKDFATMKTDAVEGLRSAKSTYNSLTRALELTIDAMEKGQLEGGIGAAVQNAYYDLFGKRPQNLAELNLLFGETTFERLKPLFGSQISDGERESVQDLYASVRKSGATNVGVLKQLLGNANRAMFNLNVLLSSDTMEDYASKLIANEDVPDSQTKVMVYDPITKTYKAQ
jgi:hypothetical protein